MVTYTKADSSKTIKPKTIKEINFSNKNELQKLLASSDCGFSCLSSSYG